MADLSNAYLRERWVRSGGTASQSNSLPSWVNNYISALLKYEDLRKAVQAIGQTKATTLPLWMDSQFVSEFMVKRSQHIGRHLLSLQETLADYQMKRHTDPMLKTQINRLEKLARDMSIEKNKPVEQVFPELDILVPGWRKQ